MNNKEIVIGNYFKSNNNECFSINSVTGCHNSSSGSWLMFKDEKVIFYCQAMCSDGMYPDNFNFNSVDYNQTEK